MPSWEAGKRWLCEQQLPSTRPCQWN